MQKKVEIKLKDYYKLTNETKITKINLNIIDNKIFI